MNYLSVKDLKAPRMVRERLAQYGQVLVLNNGRPMALMLDIPEGEDPECLAAAVRDARSQAALSRIREAARKAGTNRLSLADINAVIAKSRASRRAS